MYYLYADVLLAEIDMGLESNTARKVNIIHGRFVHLSLSNNDLYHNIFYSIKLLFSLLKLMFKVILYSYLILKKMNERITDS